MYVCMLCVYMYILCMCVYVVCVRILFVCIHVCMLYVCVFCMCVCCVYVVCMFLWVSDFLAILFSIILYFIKIVSHKYLYYLKETQFSFFKKSVLSFLYSFFSAQTLFKSNKKKISHSQSFCLDNKSCLKKPTSGRPLYKNINICIHLYVCVCVCVYTNSPIKTCLYSFHQRSNFYYPWFLANLELI